jgi:hypothetical protein
MHDQGALEILVPGRRAELCALSAGRGSLGRRRLHRRLRAGLGWAMIDYGLHLVIAGSAPANRYPAAQRRRRVERAVPPAGPATLRWR